MAPSPAMSPPTNFAFSLWRQALADLNEQDQRLFNRISKESSTDTLKDILVSIEAQRERCQHSRWKTKSIFTGREIIVRDVCAKIATCVRHFMSVVDVAVSFNPVHAGLPWAAMRFVLQLCINSFDVFAALVEGFERVARIITRSAIVETLYLDHQQGCNSNELRMGLDGAMVKMYSAVLRFLCKAKKYYDSSLVKKVANLAIKQTIEETVRAIGDAEDAFLVEKGLIDGERIKSIHESTLETNSMFASVQNDKVRLEQALIQLEKPIARTAEQMSQLHDALKEHERAALLKWLSSVPVQDQYRSVLTGMVPGSGEWLLNDAVFTSWRDSSASEALWLHGIPGCGKSRISAAVIQHLRGQGKDLDHPAPIAHFLCSRDSQEPERSHARQILMSLVKQLSLTRDMEWIRQPTVDEYQRRRHRAEHDGETPATLTADECVELICELGRTTPMTVVIDGLDECTSQEQEILLSALDRIRERSRDIVKVFVASRYLESAAARFQDSNTIQMTEETNHEDLRRFIEDGVDRFIRNWGLVHKETKDTLDSLRRSISQGLMRRAQGM